MNNTLQTKKNFIFNIITLFLNFAIGLFYTPYLVKSLGIIAYGIVPLALIINQYINVITGSLTGSLARFYSIALQQKKDQEASKYLSSSIIAIIGLVILLTPVFVYLVVNINKAFNIPLNFVPQAKLLFSFTIFGFFLSLFSSIFNVTLYAFNRLDLINIITLIRSLLRVFLTIMFFERFSKDISYIGYVSFLIEFIGLLISYTFFKFMTKNNVKISIKYFDKIALFSILSMTIWVLLHQLGDTGLYRIDNIMVNKFWSTRESGILGALSEFGTYVMIIVGTISTLFGPLILIAYSKGDHDRLKQLALTNSLYVGLLTALMVGTLCGFAKPIILLWLGQEFTPYSNWFIIKQISLPFYAAAGVLAYVFRSWNKVIIPAVVTLIIGVINLFVSYIICSNSHGNESYIFYMMITTVFFIIIQSFVLNFFVFKKLYPEVKKHTIINIFIRISITLTLTCFISSTYNIFITITNIFQLILGLGIVSIFTVILSYMTILISDERLQISDFLTSYIRINKK